MSEYSQKYCLVFFIERVSEGMVFEYSDWPLHVTLAGTFACKLRDILRVEDIVKKYESITVKGESREVFGSSDQPTPVILVSKNDNLIKLHGEVVDYLRGKGAVFNSPEFTKQGFLPHCTIQKQKMINTGDEARLNSVSIVDMFVDNDWQKRKVIKTFDLMR